MSTHINSDIKKAKQHAIELCSTLHTLASDIRAIANNNKLLVKNGLKKEKLLELVGNLDCMGTDVSYLSKELADRMGHGRWPEIGPLL